MHTGRFVAEYFTPCPSYTLFPASNERKAHPKPSVTGMVKSLQRMTNNEQPRGKNSFFLQQQRTTNDEPTTSRQRSCSSTCHLDNAQSNERTTNNEQRTTNTATRNDDPLIDPLVCGGGWMNAGSEPLRGTALTHSLPSHTLSYMGSVSPLVV